MSEREELAEALAPDVYEAYRLGRAGKQEYLDDWDSRADDGPVPGVEIASAAFAVLASPWLRAHDDRIRAEALAPVEEAVRQAGANIGAYRKAQTAIADLDRDHIDVLEVGTILSALRRDVVDHYAAALRAAAGTPTHHTTEEER